MACRAVAFGFWCAILVALPQGQDLESTEKVQQHLAVVTSVCGFDAVGSRADRDYLDICFEHLLGFLGVTLVNEEEGARDEMIQTCIGMMKGVGHSVKQSKSMRDVCWAMTGINVTARGCDALSTVAVEVLAIALRSLTICNAIGDIESLADETFTVVGDMLQEEVSVHAESPLGCLVGPKLSGLRQEFLSTLSPSSHTRQLVARLMVLSRKISEYANYIVWRDMHFLWISDSLRQGEVVHSAWGPIEHWDELGANDARTRHALGDAWGGPPAFVYSEETGRRRDILVSLLKKLHEERGGAGELLVVEVGVFRADLSKFLLEQLPFVQLLGVDPYVGTDGTFPGDFSVTLNPDSALSAARAVYESFGGRAQLLQATSEVAAQEVPDGGVDAVFVDGCHLYECVAQDLEAWVPKLRPGSGALLAGHDFSPQWPGVVRAVHERRGGGQRVFLGQDWTYWWYV